MEDSTFPIPKLPNDVIIEILTWLPVKPLLKFKCVCKSWRALISSPKFAKSHLENSKLDRNLTAQRLLMRRIHGNFTTQSLFKQLSAHSLLSEPVSEAFDLISPFQSDGRVKAVLGACNGLVCLGDKFPITGKAKNYFRIELTLWNPSTGIRKDLPDFEVRYPSEDEDEDFGISNYGFGYDKSSDDYKVVRFFRGDMDSSEPEGMLQVYSLRNDQWEAAKPLMQPFEMTRPATLVNGKLYWIGFHSVDPDDDDDDDDDDVFVVCFDLETEEYEILRFPNGPRYYPQLAEYGGSLRLICFYPFGLFEWSLDDCGVGKKDWVNVVRVPKVENGSCMFLFYVMNSPVFIVGCGSVAVYDFKDGSSRCHKIRNTGDFAVVGAYIESLVSPLGW